jgi:hypothetical protein
MRELMFGGDAGVDADLGHDLLQVCGSQVVKFLTGE